MEKKNEKGKVQLKGQLKLYIQWPAIMSLLLIAMDLWVYKLDHRAGILMAVFVVVYIIMVGGLYFYSKNIIMKDLVEFAAQYGIVQNTLLRELSIPYAILLDDGKAIWMNDEFEAILGGKPKGEAYISKYIPELNRSIFPKEDQRTVTMEVYYDDKEYQAEIRRVSVEGFSDTEQLMELPKEKEYFIAVYLQDVTEFNRIIRENEEQRMVAGLVYIDNYDEVMKFVRIINHPHGLAIGARHITISTCGLVNMIERYSNEGIQTNLAISLHAPNDEIRDQLMPVNKAFNMDALRKGVADYIEKTNRRVTFEYILLDDVNDSLAHARQLAHYMRGLNAYVNLIPYNSVDEHGFKPSSHVEEFKDELLRLHINCTVRKEHGRDIDGACGQLRAKRSGVI